MTVSNEEIALCLTELVVRQQNTYAKVGVGYNLQEVRNDIFNTYEIILQSLNVTVDDNTEVDEHVCE